jgi:orotidine-5'-phosphate decarboxylase
MAEKADARQTQNTTASLAMAAKTAEVQSSGQTAANTNTYGGADKMMSRLVEVNEGQLEQLISLVELIRNGGSAMPNAAQSPSGPQVAQTTQNPSINTPKAANKGTVSVGRT